MTHNPYSVESRKALSPKQRLKLWIDRGGICCLCHQKIDGTREGFVDEHILPLWLGGSNDWSNRGVAHIKCAQRKTADETQRRAKVRRTAERHFGAHKSSRPMLCGRKSRWKKKMNGEIVPR